MNSVLTFLGDVYLPQPVKSWIDIPGEYILNLEAPFTRRGRPALSKINLRCEENYLRESFQRLPIAVCLANNHIMDFGTEGFADTLDALSAMNVRWYGAGTTAENCYNPLILELGGTKVALLGYVCASTNPVWASGNSPGVMPIELDQIRSDLTIANRLGAKRTIVTFHWGAEQVSRPKPEDIKVARETILAGADLIVSHHAHCVQSYEMFNSKPIFYGLGNCVFPPFDLPSHYDAEGNPTRRATANWSWWNNESLMVHYDVLDESIKISSARCKDGQVTSKPFHSNRFCMTADENPKVRYETARRYSLGRTALFSFVREPRFSKLRNVVGLLKDIAG